MSKNKNKSSKSNEPQNEGTDASVFMTVFGYCLLIIVLPVIAFFAAKHFFDALDFEFQKTNIYSAISAVVVLHLALGLYLYKAYSGGPKPKTSQAKQD